MFMNRTRGWYISVLGLMMALLASLASPRGTHAAATRPFALPFRDPSGPNTWLLEQHYGNTLEAYVYGKYWYADGQGLHFGVDFEVRCGTPLLAIADGDVLNAARQRLFSEQLPVSSRRQADNLKPIGVLGNHL